MHGVSGDRESGTLVIRTLLCPPEHTYTVINSIGSLSHGRFQFVSHSVMKQGGCTCKPSMWDGVDSLQYITACNPLQYITHSSTFCHTFLQSYFITCRDMIWSPLVMGSRVVADIWSRVQTLDNGLTCTDIIINNMILSNGLMCTYIRSHLIMGSRVQTSYDP